MVTIKTDLHTSKSTNFCSLAYSSMWISHIILQHKKRLLPNKSKVSKSSNKRNKWSVNITVWVSLLEMFSLLFSEFYFLSSHSSWRCFSSVWPVAGTSRPIEHLLTWQTQQWLRRSMLWIQITSFQNRQAVVWQSLIFQYFL